METLRTVLVTFNTGEQRVYSGTLDKVDRDLEPYLGDPDVVGIEDIDNVFDLYEFCKVDRCKRLIETYVTDTYGHQVAGRPGPGILESIATIFRYDIYNVKMTIDLEVKEGKLFVNDNGWYRVNTTVLWNRVLFKR